MLFQKVTFKKNNNKNESVNETAYVFTYTNYRVYSK